MATIQGLSIAADRVALVERIKVLAKERHESFSGLLLDLAEKGLEQYQAPSDFEQEILARLSRIEEMVSHPMAVIDPPDWPVQEPHREGKDLDRARQRKGGRELLKGLGLDA
jgi:hypothetical protein